jgi:hypothetical protein
MFPWVEATSGAKALAILGTFTARLKSCPSTNLTLRAPNPFPLAFLLIVGAQNGFTETSIFQRSTSPFHVTGSSVVRGVRFLQVVPQAHIQGDGHAHYDQRAHAQDQKPPDHPHSRLG